MQSKLLHTKPVQKQTKYEPQCNTAARRRAKELDAREKDPRNPRRATYASSASRTIRISLGSSLACPLACVVGTSRISFVLIGSANSSFMLVECGTDVPFSSIVYVVLFFKPPQNRRPLRRQQCNLQRIARVAL